MLHIWFVEWGCDKMDIILISGAMFLAYAGMIILYYRLRSQEKGKKISKLMLEGVMNLRRGGYDKAATYFKIAYEYSEEINDQKHMAEALYNMGLVCKEQNDTENAVYFFQEASKIYEGIEDYTGRDKAHNTVISLKQ
ncbi:MAG: Tetratricopeptide repeat protein [Firmicutes bacterium ADurb.Bin419]|jgi:tetratricopeptide (TPR) repeat protein|nr:MAG: Tetratricopeptide repeat protein [Firmicutes bacterium ADurb.Bin419]